MVETIKSEQTVVASTSMIKTLLASIPDECPITVQHAQLHVDNIMTEIYAGDKEQAAHDADLAGRILICLGSKLRGEKWTS